ncbi:MAG: HAD domain-containing protein [Burkholderiaceae bacterium]
MVPAPAFAPVILFLDFDGVLHPDPCREACRLFEHAPRLAALLESFPEVCVVLSTSWRNGRSIDDLVGPLAAPLRARVIGVTPTFGEFAAPARLVPYRRQAECRQWLVEQGQEDRPWLALDDRASLFEPYCDRLIQCDSQRGFDAAIARRLRTALVRERQRLLRQIDTVI